MRDVQADQQRRKTSCSVNDGPAALGLRQGLSHADSLPVHQVRDSDRSCAMVASEVVDQHVVAAANRVVDELHGRLEKLHGALVRDEQPGVGGVGAVHHRRVDEARGAAVSTEAPIISINAVSPIVFDRELSGWVYTSM